MDNYDTETIYADETEHDADHEAEHDVDHEAEYSAWAAEIEDRDITGAAAEGGNNILTAASNLTTFEKIKQGLYRYLKTPSGRKEFCRQIFVGPNTNFESLTYFFDGEQILELIVPIINQYLRCHRKTDEKLILWNSLIKNKVICQLLIISDIWDANHSRNIINTFFGHYRKLSYIDIGKVVDLISILIDNPDTKNAMLKLIREYAYKFYEKTSIYTIFANSEMIKYTDNNCEMRKILFTLFILTLNKKYPGVLDNTADMMIEYGIIDYIDEIELRKTELKIMESSSEKKIFIKNDIYMVNCRLKLLKNIGYLLVADEVITYFIDSLSQQLFSTAIDETFILNYLSYIHHRKSIMILDDDTVELIVRIFETNNNIYIIEQTLEFLRHILFYEKTYFNYNQEKIINAMRSNSSQWTTNILTILETILTSKYNDENDISYFNNNIVRIANKFFSLVPPQIALKSWKELNVINHYLISNITTRLHNLNDVYTEYMAGGSSILKIKINKRFMKICANVLLLRNLNSNYEFLLSYENRNIFLELLNLAMTIFSDNMWRSSIVCNDTESIIDGIIADNPPNEVMGNLDFREFFITNIEPLIYSLLEKEYDTIAAVFINKILEFDGMRWQMVADCFAKPRFLNVFCDHIADKEIDDGELSADKLDPISLTLITNPIFLPNKIVVDKYTIYRHVLTNQENPFSREYLDADILDKCDSVISSLPK